jgi:oligopeptide transport system ATP-binding protein
MKKDKILEVNNLNVSFKTPNGIVKAVRGVSFDLAKGETLAIVGESGSGKSVTNRAIMGILAGNGFIEEGSIIYRNQDLTKLSEENFHKIRGHKIGMIFQDPLSSLNPIMRIGKQITEAMLVNGNRIKMHYLDLFHAEFYNYDNKLYEIKHAKKKLKDKIYSVRMSDELSFDEKNKKIRTLKEEYKIELAELKKEVPGLKKAYLDKKKEAKRIVKKEAADIKAERKEALAILKDKRKSAASIDEKMAVQKEIAEVREQFKRRFKVTKKEAYETAITIMNEVGIPEPEKRFYQYPFQFSGGMRQRIVIATALVANPELLICDEPTTALDVTIQSQILRLIKRIKRERDLSVVFITHDLGVVANVADRVAVMYAGKIVEYGNVEEIFYNPKHPYTWALLSSVPDLETSHRLISIPGTPPDMLYPPKGDAFAARNKYALKIDFEEQPPYFKVSETHYAATWLLHEDAPKIDMPEIIKERAEKYKAIIAEREEAGE